MKLALVSLLPFAAVAFAPVRVPARVLPALAPSTLVMRNEVDDFCEQVTSKTEEVVEKADSIVLKRVMRVVDHAPMIYTLKCLANKAGISAEMWSVTTNPSAFEGLATAISVPTWCFNVWSLLIVVQGLSVAKSALADNTNDLAQSDITASAAANWAAARALGSENLLVDTMLAAVVSGYALRNNGMAGEVTLHKASMQLMSSFTTVLAVLGAISWVTAKIPIISGFEASASVLGLAAYYVMATRAGNGTVKKSVNAGIISGVLVARLAGGIGLSLNAASVVPALLLGGTAYVAYESVNRARKALFA